MSKRRALQFTSAFDLETQTWDIPVLGGMWDICTRRYRQTRNIRELAYWLRVLPGWHWAHNGGKFDALAIIDVWLEEGFSVTATFGGGRIIAARCGNSTLCDSYALWPVKLSEMSIDGTVDKRAFPLPCVCDSNCGGYCSLRVDMSEEYYRLVGEYLEYDVIALAEKLQALEDFCSQPSVDLDLSFTLGGSAFSSAARWLGILPEKQSLAEHKVLRSAYYGGMSRTLRIGNCGAGQEMDVVNLYPSRLKALSMPVGNRREVSGSLSKRAYENQTPGIYQVCVTVPESHCPPLPIRRHNRLWYPHGTFESWYTEIELRNACDKFGVKIESFGDAVVYESTRQIFGPWIDHIFEQRAKVGKETGLGTFLKLVPNSVYGKLASRPEKERLLINPDCPLEELEDCEQIGLHVFKKSIEMIDRCSHPVWASYCTSAGRIELLDKVHEGRPEDVFMMDTDSCHSSDARPLRQGKSLGQWEIKHCKKCGSGIYKNLHVIAPKVYAKVCVCEAINSKAKGFRIPRDSIPIPNKEYRIEGGVLGAKSYGAKGRNKFFQRAGTTRLLSIRAGDRILDEETGNTRAPHISECEIKKRVRNAD